MSGLSEGRFDVSLSGFVGEDVEGVVHLVVLIVVGR